MGLYGSNERSFFNSERAGKQNKNGREAMFGKRIKKRVRGAVKDQTGLEMIEYIVMAALLVAAIVVSVYFFGDTIRNMFSATANAVAGKTTTAANERDAAQTAAGNVSGKGEKYGKGWSDAGN